MANSLNQAALQPALPAGVIAVSSTHPVQYPGAVSSHQHHLSKTSCLQESLELEQSRRRTLERQLADIGHISPRSPRVTDPRMQILEQQVGG